MVYSYQFKSICLKNHKFLAAFSLNFMNLHEICHVQKKIIPHMSDISEVIEFKKTWYFDCITGLVPENLLAVNVLASLKNS